MIRAWRYAGDELRQVERPAAHCPDDRIVVEVEASVFGAPERRAAGASGDVTPGGAGVGRVVEAGAAARDLVGKRVVIGPEQPDPESDVCRRGGADACTSGEYLGRSADGTLASHVVARARWACVLEEPLAVPGPEAAALGREAAHAYAMFVRAGVAPGEPVVIVGESPIARFLVEVAVAKGTRPLVLIDPVAPFGAWLAQRGATAVQVEPGAPGRALAEVRAAASAAGHGDRPWRIFETTAGDEQRATALSLAGPGATLALLSHRALGAPPGGLGLPVDRALDAGAILIGIAGAHPDLLAEVAALAVRGELDLAGACVLTELPSPAAPADPTQLAIVRP